MAEGMPKVIMLLGPPGAGKGTQADILVRERGMFHFETSKIIEEELRTHRPDETVTVDGRTYRYGDEKMLFESGSLMTPAVVAFWVSEHIRSLARQGMSIVFSGSPRTMFEAESLLPLLEELYGRDAIRVLVIEIPEEESLYRNTHRRICSRCRVPLPYSPVTADRTTCPRCGAPLIRRGALDTPETIKVRLREYAERTAPIIAYLEGRGIVVRHVDGMGSIEEVAERVSAALAR